MLHDRFHMRSELSSSNALVVQLYSFFKEFADNTHIIFGDHRTRVSLSEAVTTSSVSFISHVVCMSAEV